MRGGAARRYLCVVTLGAAVAALPGPGLAQSHRSPANRASAASARYDPLFRKYAKRSFDGSARIMETMQETALGARIVKSFNLERVMERRMAAAVREVERSANRMAIGQSISNPVSDVLAGFAIGGVIFYGSWRITIHNADAGSFFSFVAALLLAYEPCKRLAKLNLDIQNALVGARIEMQRVCQADQLEHGLQQVVAIVAPSRDVKKEIDLGGSGQVIQSLHGKAGCACGA